MARKGLNNEAVIAAALEMVEQKGYRNFSMRELAAALGVQPASLYNHVAGIEEVRAAVGMYGIDMLARALAEAAEHQSPGAALAAMADAYRAFAHKNPELYQAIIEVQASDNTVLKSALHKIVDPLVQVIGTTVSCPDEVIHLQRLFRSTLHGFVSLERDGYLVTGEVAADESFRFIVQWLVLLAMHSGERRPHGQCETAI